MSENKLNNSYVEKDAITITRKLIEPKQEGSHEYVTRIPYTQNYVKYPEEACTWISDKTMKVHLTDDMIIPFSSTGSFENATSMSGGNLKQYYDGVIRKRMEQQLANKQTEQTYNYAPKIEHKEIETADVNRVNQDIQALDDFSQRVYKDEKSLSYYPEMMRKDEEFVKLLSYRNQQQIFADDYVKRNEIGKAMECQTNIDVADTLIKEKTDIATENLVKEYQADMNAIKNYSSESLDVEQFKKFPADLQRDESFKSLVVYKAQLEDLRNQCIEAINTTTNNYQNAIGKAAPENILQYEKSMLQHEKVQMENITNLTKKISDVNFAIDYQVSQMQQLSAREIKPIEEQMKGLGIKTSNDIGRIFHAQEHLIRLGNSFGNLSMFQTKDGRNFVGRNWGNGKIEQIGMHGELKNIRKNFKNIVNECKQEMKLEQKQQRAQLSWDRGR